MQSGKTLQRTGETYAFLSWVRYPSHFRNSLIQIGNVLTRHYPGLSCYTNQVLVRSFRKAGTPQFLSAGVPQIQPIGLRVPIFRLAPSPVEFPGRGFLSLSDLPPYLKPEWR